MAAPITTGYDLLADKIAAVFRQSILISDKPTADLDKLRRCALLHTPIQLKHSFKVGCGKKKRAEPTNIVVIGRASKRQKANVVVTPSPLSQSTSHNVPSSPLAPIVLSKTMNPVINNPVASHGIISPSTQMPLYKRMRPPELVRVHAGQELIVVIPPVGASTSDLAKKGIEHVTNQLEAIINDTNSWMDVSEREEALVQHRRTHVIVRNNDKEYYEFCVRIRSYPESSRLETSGADQSYINLIWSQGAGIYVELCGYTKSRTAILKFQHLAYIEVYSLTSDGMFLNDNIKFPHARRESLVKPLHELLAESNGCRLSTMEVLMKYYRADSNASVRATTIAARTTPTIPNKPIANGDSSMFHAGLTTELSDESTSKFISMVDNLYGTEYRRHYSSFTRVCEYLVCRTDLSVLYNKFKEWFPICHSSFAQIVSPSHRRSYQVPLSAAFDFRDGVESNECDDNGGDDDIDDLHFKERACLEYFLGMLRIRSQKQLTYWSMIYPLAHHAKGHNLCHQRNQIMAAACTIKTARKRLDDLFFKYEQAKLDLIKQQYTMTLVFDNWQRSCPKKWQTEGKSSVFLRGTAYFIRRDKAILLPSGSTLRSPSGLIFSIMTSRFLDAYTTVLKGTLVTNIYPLPLANEGEATSYESDISWMASGDLRWPQIGWDPIHLNGLDECRDITYVDQYIPSPLRARVRKEVDLNEVLFNGNTRLFPLPDDDRGRVLLTNEYHQLIQRANNIIDLNSFAQYLADEHAWNVELQLESEEYNDVLGRTAEPMNEYIQDATQELFISLMQSMGKEINAASKFQSDIVKHLTPHCHSQDEFIHYPIYPREETSNAGMFLTSLMLHESAGLIDKTENGQYTLDENTPRRKVFVYGDALSVATYSRLKMMIHRKSTQLGSEQYVNTLLSAHNATIMQKGHFHQLMHQAAAIYKQCYELFMLPMQIANGVKRVVGDPVKGSFQDHERFMLKLYKACRRFALRQFVASIPHEEIVKADSETNTEWLVRMECRLAKYYLAWEESPHEPSKIIALFMNYVRSYLRCKFGIRNHDFWILEKESCEWLGPWKMCGKHTYLQEQCEQIENVYDDTKLSPVLREIMRSNSISVYSDSKKGMAHDESNEMYNLFLKKAPASQSLSVACERSRHIMIERKCAAEVWGQHVPEPTGTTSEASDVAFFEEILGRCNVFCQHDPVFLSNAYFWQHIRVQSSGGSDRDQQKEFVPFNTHEQSMHDLIICGIVPMEQITPIPTSEPLLDMNEQVEDDSDCISEASNDGSSIGDEEVDQIVDFVDLSDEQLVEKMNDAIQSHGIRKRKSSRKKVTILNMFKRGSALLKESIKLKRSKHLLKALRKKQFINHAVRFFGETMTKRRTLLKKCYERSASKDYLYEQKKTRTQYKELMRLRELSGEDMLDHTTNAAV